VALAAWADTTQARAHWKDAPADDTLLGVLLDVASVGCRAYAPRLRRVIADAVTTDGSTVLTAESAAFDEDLDDGAQVTAPGIPAATTMTVVDATTATLSAAATVTGTAVPVVIVRDLPSSYMLATIYQARETYDAAIRDGDVIGVGDYAIRARPLTGAVKQLLRPDRRLKATG
jgi:hypothetical protein